jgi:hypothetical protein
VHICVRAGDAAMAVSPLLVAVPETPTNIFRLDPRAASITRDASAESKNVYSVSLSFESQVNGRSSGSFLRRLRRVASASRGYARSSTREEERERERESATVQGSLTFASPRSAQLDSSHTCGGTRGGSAFSTEHSSRGSGAVVGGGSWLARLLLPWVVAFVHHPCQTVRQPRTAHSCSEERNISTEPSEPQPVYTSLGTMELGYTNTLYTT